MKHHPIIIVSLLLLAGLGSGNVEQNTNSPPTQGIAELATDIRPGWKIGAFLSDRSYDKDREKTLEIVKATAPSHITISPGPLFQSTSSWSTVAAQVNLYKYYGVQLVNAKWAQEPDAG